nr:bifunctional epoxide hydrolase 2-like [Ipomoea batatas]
MLLDGGMRTTLHNYFDQVSWRHQMIAVAKARFKAIATDYRGYELSDHPVEPDKTTNLDVANDLVALFDALSIKKLRAHVGLWKRLQHLRCEFIQREPGFLARATRYAFFDLGFATLPTSTAGLVFLHGIFQRLPELTQSGKFFLFAPPILTDLRSHFNASFVTESNREKNRRNRDGELYLSAQRETVSDLSFDLESPTAHEGALLMVTGVKRLENDRFFSALHRHNHSSRVKFFLVAVMLSSGGCGSKLGRKKNIGHPIFCCFAQLPNQVISQVSKVSS